MRLFVLLTALAFMSTLGRAFADEKDSEDSEIRVLRDKDVIFVGFHTKTDSDAGRITYVLLGQSWRGGDESLKAISGYPVMLLNLHKSPQVSDTTLAALRGLEAKYVKVQCVQITDKALDHLATMTGVKTLTLKSVPVTDEGIPALIKLKTMKRLNLLGTKLTMDGVAKLRAALPDCDVRYNSWNRIEQ